MNINLLEEIIEQLAEEIEYYNREAVRNDAAKEALSIVASALHNIDWDYYRKQNET